MVSISGDLIKRVAEKMRNRVNVHIASDPGGGRTLFCQLLVRELERTGGSILHISGHHLLTAQPLSGVSQALPELGLTAKMTAHSSPDSLAVVDAIATELHAQPLVMMIIDDVNHLDRPTLAVIDLLRNRINLVLLTTMSTRATWQNAADNMMVLGWAHTREVLSPLRFEEVTQLVTTVLGGQASSDLVTTVFTLSAGNPQLATTILRSAMQAGRIAKQGKSWVCVDDSLWNPHLESLVDAMVSGLTQRQLEGLLALTLLGPRPYDVYQKIVDNDDLAALEQHGFLTIVGAPQPHEAAPLTSVTPPLLSEYARRNSATLESLRVVSNLNEILPPSKSIWQPYRPAIDGVGRVSSSPIEAAALADLLAKQSGTRGEDLWQNWSANPTPPNGVTYLENIWDGTYSAERVEAVFTQSLAEIADFPDSATPLSLMHAEWLISHDHDFPAAMAALSQLGTMFPHLANEATAYSMLLETRLIRLVPQYIEQLEAMLPSAGPGSVIPISLAFLYLADLRPHEALRVLKGSSPRTTLAPLHGLHMLVHILALHQCGDSEEALAESLHTRQTARGNLDKLGIITATYGASAILIQDGRWAEAEHIIGSVLGTGRTGLITAPVHAAMLRFDALIAARTGRAALAHSFLQTAAETHTRHGALPAMTERFSRAIEYMLVDTGFRQSEKAAEELAALARENTNDGYLYAAFISWEGSIVLDPRLASLESMEAIAVARDNHTRDQLLQLGKAVAKAQISDIERIVKNYSEKNTAANAAVLLQTAAKKRRAQGDQKTADLFGKSFDMLRLKFPLSRLLDSVEIGVSRHSLSRRENQIALLVDSLSNAEIAERLGISVRTVENHIHNSLKKTGLEKRAQLFAFVVDLL